ncbi:hypothetical protein SDC9_170536 [bioreactor metagenome]|uniref:Uncharacterized protein n=1 Tax=bioreactor metagenome TaxID=1076179 RepID=A0A645GBH5_9ZZZZ
MEGKRSRPGERVEHDLRMRLKAVQHDQRKRKERYEREQAKDRYGDPERNRLLFITRAR